MIRTYTIPASKAAAQHLAEVHLRAALNTNHRARFTFRLIDALIGIGYAVLATDLPGEPATPAERRSSND